MGAAFNNFSAVCITDGYWKIRSLKRSCMSHRKKVVVEGVRRYRAGERESISFWNVASLAFEAYRIKGSLAGF
jgi:hypothetical protein